MSLPVVALLFVCALIVGVLIGTVGIGGVLLAPALTFLAGVDVHEAMGTSMCAFVLTGVAGTASYARRGTLDWGTGARLGAGAMPGALVGAWANGLLSDQTLKVVLAVLLVATGAYALTGVREAPAGGMPRGAVLAGVGLAIGAGSALTGTGGPVLTVPALLLLGVPALATVGVSQLVQLPIAAFGALGFALYGEVDLLLGLALGVVASGGVLLGAHIAHAVPAAWLRRGVAAACVLAGVTIAIATWAA